MHGWVWGAAALWSVGCMQGYDTTAATHAKLSGVEHVVVRAEFGHLWWSRASWTEPHELWRLPGRGEVKNLLVTHRGNAFLVTFDQDGSSWQGRFGDGEKPPQRREP